MSNLIEKIIAYLTTRFNWDTMPETTPTTPENQAETPVIAPSVPETVNPTLSDFLKYQWQFEGANPANNNPGNYRYYYGGYLPMYEPVKRSPGGFAQFPTLILGEDYATECTKNVVKNHPELTILTYIGGDGDWSGYAPASDNNSPETYANFIANGLSTTPQFLMKNLIGIV